MIKQVVLVIKGRVQGVFYRAEAREQAMKLGIIGYAQNNRDGTVTICASGEEKPLEEFITWCRKGPDYAQVDNVEVTAQNSSPEQFHGFEIY